jgi:hypothetical protein
VAWWPFVVSAVARVRTRPVLVGIVFPPALTLLMLAVGGRARYAAGTKNVYAELAHEADGGARHGG